MTPGEVVATAALAGLLFGPVSRLADLANVFEQAAASVERLGEILDREPDVAEPARARPDRPGARARRVRPGRLRLQARPPGPLGRPAPGRARDEGRPRRPDRLRQEHAPEPAPAVLRPDLGRDPARRRAAPPTCPRPTSAGRSASCRRTRSSSPEPGRQHPLRRARRRPRPRRGRRAGGPGPRLRRRRCPTATRRSSARGATSSARASGSGWRSPAPSARTRPLVVLDEATSSLDTASEALIQAALANLLAGRTAFIIAHRLATVVDADLIVVMDGGLVVQAGTHAELLADEARPLPRGSAVRQFAPTPASRGDPAGPGPPADRASEACDGRRTWTPGRHDPDPNARRSGLPAGSRPSSSARTGRRWRWPLLGLLAQSLLALPVPLLQGWVVDRLAPCSPAGRSGRRPTAAGSGG